MRILWSSPTNLHIEAIPFHCEATKLNDEAIFLNKKQPSSRLEVITSKLISNNYLSISDKPH